MRHVGRNTPRRAQAHAASLAQQHTHTPQATITNTRTPRHEQHATQTTAPAAAARLVVSSLTKYTATAIALLLASCASSIALRPLPQLNRASNLLEPSALAAPTAQSRASLRAKRLRISLRAKLTKVPVFMVTNEQASPYLSQLPSGDQTALMFLYPTEASNMLRGVRKAPNAAGAKIHVTNLDRAFRLALREPRLSGLRDQTTNRELTMVWQFMPSGTEQRSAQGRLVKSMKVSSAPRVPAYMVEGLVYTRRGKEVRPVFMSAADAEEAAAKLGLDSTPAVEVFDLLELLVQLEEDMASDPAAADKEISSLDFVPPSESVDFHKKIEKEKVPLKARVFMPTRGLLG